MVGRTEEQAYLAGVVAGPEQSGALVTGSAGVGKTRLVREVVERATGFHAEFVIATESAQRLPFGAVAHLLPEDLGTIDRVDLLAVIGRHLVRRTEGKPALLVVDDAHLLDESSAALVLHVATAGTAAVLLTLRSGEPAPDAVDVLHRNGILSRLELQPISRREFDELIEGALDGLIERPTLDRMWAVTEGNVLFAHELVDDALDAGTLTRDHGVWRWTGGLGRAPRLQEIVRTRLRGLDSAQRSFLEVLALGEPLDLATAEFLSPTVSMPELERRHLVTVETVDERIFVRLAHPLFGDALRRAMPVTLHRRINHALAEALDRATDRHQPGDAVRLALLREAAGDVVDPGILVQAARNANLLWDHRLAERLARSATLGGDPFDAQLELGRALLGQNRFEEAEVVLMPLVGDEPSDAARERLADSILMVVGYALDRPDEALQVAESIEHTVKDQIILSLMQCHRAAFLAYGARFSEAAELGIVALDSVKDDTIRVRSLASVGSSLVMSGRIDEALELSDGTFGAALQLRDRLPRAPAWAVSARCTALFFAGRASESIELLDFALAQGAGSNLATLAAADTYRGRYLLFQGRPHSANRSLLSASVSARGEPTASSSWCLALAAESYALLGNHDEAKSAAREAVSLRRRGVLAFEADEQRALAWVDAQDGRSSLAIDQLWVAADLAASRGQLSFEMIILEDLLRLGERAATTRAKRQAEQVDGEWSKAIALHAGALQSEEAADFETAAAAFAGIGASLVAAELWAAASTAAKQEGRPARATKAASNSAEQAERCEGARTEVLGWAVARVPLSRRERETCALAANGRTNAQIATDLSISERTVESHLYSAFAKLGISDRKQLLNAIREP